MTQPVGEVLHVLGVAAPGDTTTAAARALRDRLADEGVPGRLAAAEVRGSGHGVERLGPAPLEGTVVVVHTHDGGEALGPAVGRLRGARVHLVHHGSRPGSDRSVLRMLRDGVTTSTAADPSAREELRGLGFGEPAVLPPTLLAASPSPGDRAMPDGGDDHPGPHLLAVGPIAEGRSLEVLVDAFAQLLRVGVPSAVLSICGPAHPWYLEQLSRRVLRRGLVACEVLVPEDEAAVRSRLARCDVLVVTQPVGLDPYLWDAAARAKVVAPAVAATAPFSGAANVFELDVRPTRDQLVAAMRRALLGGTAGGAARPRHSPARLRQLLRVA